jgi:hypothetical protein
LVDGSFLLDAAVDTAAANGDEEEDVEMHGRHRNNAPEKSCGTAQEQQRGGNFNNRSANDTSPSPDSINRRNGNNHGNDSITAFVSQIITTATTEGLSKSSSTNGHPHHPTALLVAVITALLASRRGVWMMQSVRSSLRLLASASSWYLNRLEVSPLLTKCLTGGIIALIGDYGAQWFEYKLMKSRSVGPVVAAAVEAAGG